LGLLVIEADITNLASEQLLKHQIKAFDLTVFCVYSSYRIILFTNLKDLPPSVFRKLF